jgi:hypothetical protein
LLRCWCLPRRTAGPSCSTSYSIDQPDTATTKTSRDPQGRNGNSKEIQDLAADEERYEQHSEGIDRNPKRYSRALTLGQVDRLVQENECKTVRVDDREQSAKPEQKLTDEAGSDKSGHAVSSRTLSMTIFPRSGRGVAHASEAEHYPMRQIPVLDPDQGLEKLRASVLIESEPKL